MVLGGGNGFADSRKGLCEEGFVIVHHLKIVHLFAGRIRHGKERRVAQIAVPVHGDQAGVLAAVEAKGKAGNPMVGVLRIGGFPFGEEGFHAQAVRPYAVYQVAVAAEVIVLGFLRI